MILTQTAVALSVVYDVPVGRTLIPAIVVTALFLGAWFMRVLVIDAGPSLSPSRQFVDSMWPLLALAVAPLIGVTYSAQLANQPVAPNVAVRAVVTEVCEDVSRSEIIGVMGVGRTSVIVSGMRSFHSPRATPTRTARHADFDIFKNLAIEDGAVRADRVLCFSTAHDSYYCGAHWVALHDAGSGAWLGSTRLLPMAPCPEGRVEVDMPYQMSRDAPDELVSLLTELYDLRY